MQLAICDVTVDIIFDSVVFRSFSCRRGPLKVALEVLCVCPCQWETHRLMPRTQKTTHFSESEEGERARMKAMCGPHVLLQWKQSMFPKEWRIPNLLEPQYVKITKTKRMWNYGRRRRNSGGIYSPFQRREGARGRPVRRLQARTWCGKTLRWKTAF